MTRFGNSLAILLVVISLGGGRAAHAQDRPPAPPAVEEVGRPGPPYPPAPEATPAPSPRPAAPAPIESTDAPAWPPAPPPSTLPPWSGSPPPAPPAPPATSSGSYGSQIVLVDLGAILVGALAAQRTGSATPILVLWSFGSPVVHAVHGNPGRGLASLLLHVGLPIVGGFAGVAIEDCSHTTDGDFNFCGVAGLLLGGLTGMVAATTIDAAFLAQPPDAQPTRLAYGRGMGSAPALAVSPRGDLTLGWRGTF
jgi:hypothetical protein